MKLTDGEIKVPKGIISVIFCLNPLLVHCLRAFSHLKSREFDKSKLSYFSTDTG